MIMRRWFFLSLLGLSFFIATAVLAIGTSYFEFALKISNPLNISDQTGSVYEVFLPQNDHLSGIDVWVDNPGAGGQVSFGLRRDGSDTLLAAATVNILADVQPTFEGTRIHIDFPSQVAVASDDKYSLKILSEIPDFRVYQSNRRVILLEHTAPYTSEYINGAARIDDTEQDYGFKFALYETQESIPPVVTNATTSIVSLSEVKLEFNANEPVDFKVQYDAAGGGILNETNFSGQYTLCSLGASPCTVILSVTPDTTYNYVLTAKDEWSNSTEVSGSFDSATSSPPDSGSPPPEYNPPPVPEPDTTPPVISGLRAVWTTKNSAKIAWTTDEVADASLRITTDAAGNLGAVAFISDPIFELEHVLTSPAVLAASTTYYAHISSADLSGNNVNGSMAFETLPGSAGTETTSPESPTNPPAGNSGSGTGDGGLPPPPTVDFSSSEGTLQWQIPKEGAPENGYRIDIFDENNNLVKQVFVKSGNDTNAKIRGLAPGKYTIIIYSNRRGVFEKIAAPTQIIIPPKTLMELIIQFWYIYIAIIAAIVIGPWYLIKKEQARLKRVAE